MAIKKHMILMHQNTEVARTLDGDIGGEWKVCEPHLLPTGLRFREISKEVKMFETEFIKKHKLVLNAIGRPDFKTREMADKWETAWLDVRDAARDANKAVMLKWLAHRVLPLNRQNAKKIHQILNLPQDNTFITKAQIAASVSALSIMDNYWITYLGDEKTWDTVDIRKHSLSNGIAVVALSGNSLTLNTNELVDPLASSAELSTHGAYPKGIFRESDGLYMYKTGSLYTVAAEIAVSKILDCSNVFGHVEYTYAKKAELDCGKCKLMTNERRDVVHAAMMTDNAVGYALSHFREQLAQMCVVDYITANTDRHGLNWGFFREAPSWGITGLHWLYDHNNAFDTSELQGKETAQSCLAQDTQSGNKRIGLFEAAQRMYKYSNFKFVKPVPKSAFKLFGGQSDLIVKAFLTRCTHLGIDVVVK